MVAFQLWLVPPVELFLTGVSHTAGTTVSIAEMRPDFS